ncbi:hypothetical protein F511_30761 [Dorcoceras hygrometricum]|uniref:Uncharacterized protein n=1 Tax=Dorcoceras hygrometricum TaxID=472368 RepID=A0A2Z7BTG7_9LAMI|nr:hypothetical protein F511_30761 [Dorcoceras hygrometricum]
MSWRDNIYTFTPRTPERSPNLTSFLDAMREKSYNAPELIQEDLLCAFRFSRRGVEMVGDLGTAVSCFSRVLVYMYYSSPALTFILFSLCADERMGKEELVKAMQEEARASDERMGKAELVKAMQEEARASGEVGPPKKAARKRPAVSLAEEEARLEKRNKKGASTSGTQPGESPKMTRVPTPPMRTSEETSGLQPAITIPEVSSPMRGKGPERVLPFDFSKDSLVDSPTGVVSTRLMCNMVSDRDLPVMKGAEDSEVIGHLAVNLASAMAWGGEIIRRLTRAHRTGKTNRKKFDEAMGRHAEMVARLEELEKSYASLPVRNWAYVPSWSGLFVCVEELCEFASAELGLCVNLGSSPEEFDT